MQTTWSASNWNYALWKNAIWSANGDPNDESDDELFDCRFIAFGGAAFPTPCIQCRIRWRQPMHWVGVVTKVEWMNPHAHFNIDVKGANGTVTNWSFELGSTLQLHRQGWTRDSLKVGDQITVDGYPAKDGAKMASAKKVIFADGHSVFGDSPTDRAPTDYKEP